MTRREELIRLTEAALRGPVATWAADFDMDRQPQDTAAMSAVHVAKLTLEKIDAALDAEN